MQKCGFYIISDEFYNDFPDPYLMGNKSESRPHCYALRDDKSGLYWMIPMSSRVEKYEQIIDRHTKNNKPCDILHIAKIVGKKASVFLIQDIFPVTEKYISHEYTVGKKHLTITNEKLAAIIEHKSRKTLGMIRRGVKFSPTQPNVLEIEKKLLEDIVIDNFIGGIRSKNKDRF